MDNIALLRFENNTDMIDYLTRAVGAAPNHLQCFGPHEIARLVHQCSGKSAGDLAKLAASHDKENQASGFSYDLGLGSITGKAAIEAYKIFSTFIEKELLSAAKKFYNMHAGLPHLKINIEKLQETIEEVINFEPVEVKSIQGDQSATQIHYINQSKSCLVTHGPELKLFQNDPTNAASDDWSSFSNFAVEPTDNIFLSLPQKELSFILRHLDFTQLNQTRIALIRDFLRYFASQQSYDGHRVATPYIMAFQGVRALLAFAVEQY